MLLLSNVQALIIILCLVGYVYLKKKYFSLKGSVPGMNPHFLFGNLLQTRCLYDESYINIQKKLKQKFGDVYQYWLGPYHYYVFNKAEHAEHIFTHKIIYDLPTLTFGLQFPRGLVSIRGGDYRRHVRLILPMLKKATVSSHLEAIINATDKLITDWKKENHEYPLALKTDIGEQSKRLLLDIISVVAFKCDLHGGDIDDSKFDRNALNQALNVFTRMYDTLVKTAGIPKILLKCYMRFDSEYQNALTVLQNYVDHVINRCLKQYQHDNDGGRFDRPSCLIDALICGSKKKENQHERTTCVTHEGLSRDELVDEIFVLLIAGFATTSSAVSWFIHYMSKYPKVQDKLKDELKTNGIMKDTHLTMDLLNRLTYVDCVLNELLRFAPIVNSVRRTLTRDDIIDGVPLKKGDSILVPIYNLHMDPRYWKLDPSEFTPERFDKVDRNHHPFALLPFGGGHRQCIGQELARFELKVIITRLMQNLVFIDGGENSNTGGHRQSLTNSPRNIGVYIQTET